MFVQIKNKKFFKKIKNKKIFSKIKHSHPLSNKIYIYLKNKNKFLFKYY